MRHFRFLYISTKLRICKPALLCRVEDDFASANTDLLAAGISEALITTAFGLIIAVPAIIFYRYFEQKTVILMSILQANTSIFLDFLYKK